jgi:hypothetical protein
MTKTIAFRGQTVYVDDARSMIQELAQELARVDPKTDTAPPQGQVIPVVGNPRWFSTIQPTAQDSLPAGAMILMLDPGLGWRGYVLPWPSAAELASGLTRQLGIVAAGGVTEPPAPAPIPEPPKGRAPLTLVTRP